MEGHWKDPTARTSLTNESQLLFKLGKTRQLPTEI